MQRNRARAVIAVSITLGLVPVLVLVLAACSGGSSEGPGVASVGSSGESPASSPSAASSSAGSAVAYAACMRHHGVANFPDPDSHENLTKQDAQALGVGSQQLEAARTACQHLLPTGGSLNPTSFRQCVSAGACAQALVQQAMSEMRNFARCMRNHGVSNWPDPGLGPNGVPGFDLSGAGFSRRQARSGPIRSAQRTCGHEIPDTGGVPVR